ncbi:unnamed protein product, partial [marine sediment metagenome]
SSDIDIQYVYFSSRGGSTGTRGADGVVRGAVPNHEFFVRLAAMITRALNEATADGFVFRVDLGLRPEGRSGPLANAVRHLELYYESWGQTWERAALLRARPVAGDLGLGGELLERLIPFVYRRYLDYPAIEEIKEMKLRIDREAAHRRGGWDAKLGRGGIREIEFTCHALQLIYGGRNPRLRERNTLRAIEKLGRHSLLAEDDERGLKEAYVFLRNLEHRLQLLHERQSHTLPEAQREIAVLARRLGLGRGGEPDSEARARLEEVLGAHRGAVSRVYGDFFRGAEEDAGAGGGEEDWAAALDEGLPEAQREEMMRRAGFGQPKESLASIRVLATGPPHAHLAARSRQRLERLLPRMLAEAAAAADPDLAVRHLGRFITSSRARYTLLALLEENPETRRLLIKLFGSSTFLANFFIRN